jgi:SOS-response transcriptional repressor LexA
MPPLTVRQSEALAFIVECQDDGWTPTIQEIAEAFDASTAGVFWTVRALAKKGFLVSHKGHPRRIDVLNTGEAEVVRTVWGQFEVGCLGPHRNTP